MTPNNHSQPRHSSSNSPLQTVMTRPRRGQHRERDFGIGYGNSSGYGCSRRYSSDWTGTQRFRCG